MREPRSGFFRLSVTNKVYRPNTRDRKNLLNFTHNQTDRTRTTDNNWSPRKLTDGRSYPYGASLRSIFSRQAAEHH